MVANAHCWTSDQVHDLLFRFATEIAVLEPLHDFWEHHCSPVQSALAQRCILAGSNEGSRVLDPFGGAGTTGLVAAELGRKATLIELNPDYAELTRGRLGDLIIT